MACRSCGSDELMALKGELTASFTSVKAAKLPPLYVCEDLLACTSCGFTELRIPPKQLQDFSKTAVPGS